MKLIGVDTGGTFTDFVYVEDGSFRILKVPSTPRDPSQAVVHGVKQIVEDGEPFRIIHGSTVATNTLLERKGARVALVTNRGLEDVIEIQRQNRERIYDLRYRKPEPLVPKELRFGVKGRVDSKGRVVDEIDPSEIGELALKLKELGVEAVAVCFLFCFLHKEHEAAVADILRRAGFRVYPSCEILPVFREYERTSTTVINAYVAPKMEGYLGLLEKRLGGGTVRVMQSNGGIISVSKASKEAVRTILSGPAGGVVAAKFLGSLVGEKNLITLDMGGTSTDVSLIHGGRERLTTEYKIGGLPVGIPVIDIHTIGAGGGSIARIDAGGSLRVGPESAGADPGPICYGRGDQVTITDAHLFLGRLIPEYFLGGGMKLFPERVKPYMEELARRAGMDTLELAEGIISVANSNMEAAIRVVSVERGHDPRDYTLVVFGGAGALHGAMLARSLNIKRVLVPRYPGIFSAIGMILADTVRDYSLTVMLREPEAEQLKEAFAELRERATVDMEAEGFSDFLILENLQCRFAGQSYEVEVPFSEDYRSAFMERYRKLYGYVPSDAEVEVVNLTLLAVGRTEKPDFPKIPKGSPDPPRESFVGTRRIWADGKFTEAKVYKREELLAGNIITGPAVVVEYSSTCFVPEGFLLRVDGFGNMIMEKEHED